MRSQTRFKALICAFLTSPKSHETDQNSCIFHISNTEIYSALHVRLHFKSHEKLFVVVMCDWYHAAGSGSDLGSTSKRNIFKTYILLEQLKSLGSFLVGAGGKRLHDV